MIVFEGIVKGKLRRITLTFILGFPEPSVQSLEDSPFGFRFRVQDFSGVRA